MGEDDFCVLRRLARLTQSAMTNVGIRAIYGCLLEKLDAHLVEQQDIEKHQFVDGSRSRHR